MTLPGSTETIRDFGLGITLPASTMPLVYGVTSLGAQNEVAIYSSPNTLRDERGEGPAVECAANILTQGGGPIALVSADPSVAASNGAVTKAGTGDGVITLSGTATVDAHLRVEIVQGGINGAARFRYCLDGYDGDTESERTYSEILTVPSGGVFAIPGLGVTMTFADDGGDDEFDAGDVHTADVQCAAWNASDLADAFAAIDASPIRWRFVPVVTSRANGDPAAHAVLAAALNAQLAALASKSKYRRGMISAGNGAAAATATAFASTVATRCLVAYGRVKRVTTKPFPGYAAPVTGPVDVFAARAARSLISTDLKRVRSGPLEEILKLFHDEYRTPSALDSAKISTLRTWEHESGFFVAQGYLKSPPSSDFRLWPMGLVMDVAAETVNAVTTKWVGSGVRFTTLVENDQTYPGVIDDRDATRFENNDLNPSLQAQLTSPTNEEGFEGHVTGLRARIVRTHNVLATSIVLVEVGIKPLAYVDYVNTVLGFVVDIPQAA